MAPDAQLTDEKLFERYRKGDDAALRELIERFHDPLLRFLYRLVGDRQGAEDVFQDTFLQLHLSADMFDATRRFRPWLFTIAANKGRDHLRKKRRRQGLELSAPLSPSGDGRGESFVDLLEVDMPAAGDGLDQEERDRMVQEALSRLSPTLREILLLAYFNRLSYAQIAEDLEIPLGTVKSRLHAAVAAFGRAWKALNAAGEK